MDFSFVVHVQCLDLAGACKVRVKKKIHSGRAKERTCRVYISYPSTVSSPSAIRHHVEISLYVLYTQESQDTMSMPFRLD